MTHWSCRRPQTHAVPLSSTWIHLVHSFLLSLQSQWPTGVADILEHMLSLCCLLGWDPPYVYLILFHLRDHSDPQELQVSSSACCPSIVYSRIHLVHIFSLSPLQSQWPAGVAGVLKHMLSLYCLLKWDPPCIYFLPSLLQSQWPTGVAGVLERMLSLYCLLKWDPPCIYFFSFTFTIAVTHKGCGCPQAHAILSSTQESTLCIFFLCHLCNHSDSQELQTSSITWHSRVWDPFCGMSARIEAICNGACGYWMHHKANEGGA